MHDARDDAEDSHAEDTAIVEVREALHGEALRLLVIIDDVATTHAIPLTGRLTLGRGRANDITLSHESVSRDHAFLDLDPLRITDRGSRNGTHVRGAAIEPGAAVPLTIDEPIRLGDVVVVIKHASVSAPDHFDIAPSPVNLAAECARSARAGTSFVFARVLVEPVVTANAIEAVLGTVRVSDQLSHNQDGELLVLFTDTPAGSHDRVIDRLVEALRRAGITARVGVAHYPSDGTTPAQLLARTWQQLLSDRGAVDPMDAVRYSVAQLAAGDLSILLCGETGVGKELYAEIIHRSSPRSRGPLIKLNCAALTPSLLDTELFGHERGAFTGAAAARPGLIEAADGGTLFLDEVGEVPPELQAKLLRVVEDREVRRVGANVSRRIDVRFIAATNRSLEDEVAAGRYRRDLLFRIAGATITIPPLRERREDIGAIARAIIELASRRPGDARPTLSNEALAALRDWKWPGNVRELRNTIERAMLVARGRTITVKDLGLEAESEVTGPHTVRGGAQSPLPASVEAHERAQILAALEQCGGNKSKAARLLGIARNTLLARLDAWGMRETKK